MRPLLLPGFANAVHLVVILELVTTQTTPVTMTRVLSKNCSEANEALKRSVEVAPLPLWWKMMTIAVGVVVAVSFYVVNLKAAIAASTFTVLDFRQYPKALGNAQSTVTLTIPFT